MSRPSKTSSRKAWVRQHAVLVMNSVRPVSVSTLKSTGPMRSVCTVDSAICFAKSDGCPVFSSRMRPSTAEAMALLAVPGGRRRARAPAQQRQLYLGEERLTLEVGLAQLLEEVAEGLRGLRRDGRGRVDHGAPMLL